jgi:hypothetical protein
MKIINAACRATPFHTGWSYMGIDKALGMVELEIWENSLPCIVSSRKGLRYYF